MRFIDGHCDTITAAMDKGENLRHFGGHLNLEKMLRFAPSVQVFSIWLNDERLIDPYQSTVDALDWAHNEFDKNADLIAVARSYGDIVANDSAGKNSALLGIEGGYPLGADMNRLYALHERGVRVLTMTWNHDNALSGGIATSNATGLSQFGRDVVAECAKLGIAIDVSHISTKGFDDVASVTTVPFFASHSNCKAITDHRRNLTDQQISTIANRGGVVSLNLYDDFLSNTHDPTMEDALRHLDHMLQVGGAQCPSLGGDLDGIEDPKRGWFADVSIYEALYDRVCAAHGSTIADNIFFANYLRMFKDVLR